MKKLILFTILILSLSNNLYLNADTIGSPIAELRHSDDINSIAITKNFKYIISGSSDNTLKLWSTGTNIKVIRTFYGHVGSVNSVAISPNEKFVISTSHDKTLKLWNIKTGELIKTFYGHAGSVNSVAISPNGKYVVSGSSDKTLKLWNIKTGEHIKTFIGHNNSVNSVSISPSGKYVVSGSSDKTSILWDINAGQKIKTFDSFFSGHSASINVVIFSLDEKYVFSAGDDNTIKQWNINSGDIVRTYNGHIEKVNFLDITKNGRYLVSSSNDDLWADENEGESNLARNIFKLWDTMTGEEVIQFKGFGNNTKSVKISPDEKYIYSAGLDNLSQWSLETGKMIKSFNEESRNINSFSFTLDKNHFFLTTETNAQLWNIKAGKLLKSVLLDNLNFFKVESFNKHILASVKHNNNEESRKYSFKLLDANTFNTIKKFSGYFGPIYDLRVTPDSKYVLCKSGNYTLELWNIESGNIIQKFKVQSASSLHEASFYEASISPDGKYVVSVNGSGKIKLWNIRTGKEIRTFEGNYSISNICFSPDGKYILSGTSADVDKTMKLWNIETGKKIRTFKGHSSWISSVSFSPDGKYALSGSGDSTVKLWDIKTGKELKTFSGHSGGIKDVKIINKGRYAISRGSDNTIIYWDLKNKKEVLKIVLYEDGEWVSITPDGYFDASENGAKHLNILTGPMEVTSIDAYYETFYRPDIVAATLQGKSIDTGVRLADVKPAPSIEIINAVTNTSKQSTDITLKIKDNGGGIGDIRLYRNGTAISLDSRALKRKKDKNTIYKTYTVVLENGKNEIKAIAFDEKNMGRSEYAVHNIKAKFKTVHKPSIQALVIGIEEYRNSRLNLRYAVDDAKLFADSLKKHSMGLFENVNVILLSTKEQTTKEAITTKLKEMQTLNPNDLFVFYVASHGTVDDGEYFLITSNVGSTSTRKLKQDAISQEQIKQYISNIPTSKKMIVLDTCNSQALGDSIQIAMMTRGMSESTAMKVLSRAVGSTIFSASTSAQEALEGYKGHGLFTYVLSNGLKGEADFNKDGYVKTLELADYIDERVPELAEKEFGREQFPMVNPNGMAFPVSRVR